MSTYYRVFICQANGVKRLRCAEGASYVQDNVVEALKASRPNDNFTVVEIPHPGYSTLTRKLLFLHTGLNRDLETIKRYCSAANGKVVGSQWVVSLYDHEGDYYGLAGVCRDYGRALKVGKEASDSDPAVDYFNIGLVRNL